MTNIQKSTSLLFLLLLFVFACTGQKETVTPPTPTEPVEEKITLNERGCEMYGGDESKAKAAISLYRENFKMGNYQEALPNWRWVFVNAPGLREQTFKDGETMYKSFMESEENTTQKAAYFDTLMMIYDQRAICWGESAYLSGKKALMYYQFYPEQEEVIKDFIQKAVKNGDTLTPPSQLRLYYRYLVKDLETEKLSLEDFSQELDFIHNIIDFNLTNGEARLMADYEEAKDKIKTSEDIDTGGDKGSIQITSCEDVHTHIVPKYRANPDDLAIMKRVYAGFYKFKCFKDPLFLEVLEKLCAVEPSPPRLRTLASIYRSQKNHVKAIDYYRQSNEVETNPTKKAETYMKLASIYAWEQSNKDFSSARKEALNAAGLKSNWGEPYIFIGRMYASSGSLCGPGTGFESQKVLWPAFDMWYKARSLDPSSADEAQKWINQYYQYLPTKKDIFQRGINEGGQYSIGCWIGGKGTVRIKK